LIFFLPHKAAYDRESRRSVGCIRVGGYTCRFIERKVNYGRRRESTAERTCRPGHGCAGRNYSQPCPRYGPLPGGRLPGPRRSLAATKRYTSFRCQRELTDVESLSRRRDAWSVRSSLRGVKLSFISSTRRHSPTETCRFVGALKSVHSSTRYDVRISTAWSGKFRENNDAL